MIYFNEEFHEYRLGSVDGIKPTSVSKVIDFITPPFPSDAAYKVSLKGKTTFFEELAKKQKMSLSQVYDRWDFEGELTEQIVKKVWKDLNEDSTTKGTAIHAKKEKEAYEKGAYQYDSILHEGKEWKVGLDLSKVRLQGLYAELPVYNYFYKVCGTADEFRFEDDGFHIIDFKSNRDLKKKAFKNQTLLSPVSHLINDKITKYTIQMSLYSYMVEQFGYKWKSSTLIHIDDNGNEEPIPVPYWKREVKAILDYFKLINK